MVPGTSYLRRKYGKLTRGLCELVEDFGLVSFLTLSIEDKESVRRVVQLVDKSVGYFNAGGYSAATSAPAAPDGAPSVRYDERALVSHAASLSEYERNFEVQERFFKDEV